LTKVPSETGLKITNQLDCAHEAMANSLVNLRNGAPSGSVSVVLAQLSSVILGNCLPSGVERSVRSN
jgi:hypothetical protein